MNASISAPDATAPSAPGTLAATSGLGQVSLGWGAATDNVGVASYNVHRGTTAGFAPSAGEPDRAADGDELHRQRPDAGHLLLPGHRRGRGRQRRPGGTRRTAPRRRTPPRPRHRRASPRRPHRDRSRCPGAPSTDAGGIARYNVYRGTTTGFVPSAGNRIAQPTGTSYTDTGLAGGTYYYRVTAQDAAGNVSRPPTRRARVVPTARRLGSSPRGASTPASGTTAADQSGNGNTARSAAATWTTAGKYGNALTFDGVNDLVTVADANSLDLTTGMTLEAWVRPTALGNDWRTAILKEQPGDLSYALYAAGTDATKVRRRRDLQRRLPRPPAPAHARARTPGRTSPATYDGTVAHGLRQRRPGRRNCSSPARSPPPPARSRSAATTSGPSGSRATSTRSASTTARSAPPRSRPT